MPAARSSRPFCIDVDTAAPFISSLWHVAQSACSSRPMKLSDGFSIRWLLWQARHSPWPIASKIGLLRALAEQLGFAHVALRADVGDRGRRRAASAPWLPWHVLQVGADVSPRLSSAAACTLAVQSSGGCLRGR